MSRFLTIFSTSSTDKLIEFNLAPVSKLSVLGKELLFLMDVHFISRKLIKIINFFKKKSASRLFSV